MAKSQIKDVFTNRTMVQLIQSGANALTFSQIRFGVGLFEGIAVIINRLLFYPNSTALRELITAADMLQLALTNRNDLTVLDPTNLSILAMAQKVSVGIAVEPATNPIELDFRTNPGGGLLIPANPLFFAVDSTGFAAAATIRMIIEYQWKRLSAQENIELLQTLLPGAT